ncbi:hypothetical protein [Oryzicola mucosus]|uniref:Uncharacterized protein n=1 Tax=Oryzicola mucosus TaxID=2767425 RepID=A0A8J6U799_9HYPH|nr:hypothetical protein [Oryzicola mucosus]MBD0414492.1 hypothetical protein [Oryzicola mucosus]
MDVMRERRRRNFVSPWCEFTDEFFCGVAQAEISVSKPIRFQAALHGSHDANAKLQCKDIDCALRGTGA